MVKTHVHDVKGIIVQERTLQKRPVFVSLEARRGESCGPPEHRLRHEPSARSRTRSSVDRREHCFKDDPVMYLNGRGRIRRDKIATPKLVSEKSRNPPVTRATNQVP